MIEGLVELVSFVPGDSGHVRLKVDGADYSLSFGTYDPEHDKIMFYSEQMFSVEQLTNKLTNVYGQIHVKLYPIENIGHSRKAEFY